MTAVARPFELIPAIDLLGGEAVRLAQGDYARATVYERDPARVARQFQNSGIRRLHVVDLEGAKAGRPMAEEPVRRILAEMGETPVQLGGGLRDRAGIEEALSWGLDRVILGTIALRDPDLVKAAARANPIRGSRIEFMPRRELGRRRDDQRATVRPHRLRLGLPRPRR